MASQIQVQLTEDVDHLGYKGDVVEVKKGYWRNFLRPRGKATAVTEGMLQDLLDRMERRRLMEAQSSDEAKELRDMLQRTTISIEANVGPTGKLYGSVSADDISKALENVRKLKLDPKKIVLKAPLKETGTHKVQVALFGGIEAELETTIIGREVVVEEAEADKDAEAVAPEGADAEAAADAADGEAPADADDAATAETDE